MARRRRTKYTWLPNTGTGGPVADVQDSTNGRDFGELVSPQDGTTAVAILDLLVDEPSEEIVTGPIGPIIGSEYFLKRVVGKIFIGNNQQELNITPAVLVGFGIFVARAEDVDSGGPNLPIGALTQAQAVDNYSPLRQETVREPWVWRRTWILSNLQAPGASLVNGAMNFPANNTDYGSVLDGAHIDAKTARRISQDDRLFAVLAVRNYPLNTIATQAGGSVRAYIDYRALGALRKARNRSAF